MRSTVRRRHHHRRRHRRRRHRHRRRRRRRGRRRRRRRRRHHQQAYSSLLFNEGQLSNHYLRHSLSNIPAIWAADRACNRLRQLLVR